MGQQCLRLEDQQLEKYQPVLNPKKVMEYPNEQIQVQKKYLQQGKKISPQPQEVMEYNAKEQVQLLKKEQQIRDIRPPINPGRVMEYHPKKQIKVLKKQYKRADQVMLLCQPEYLAQKMDLSTILWVDQNHANFGFLSRTYPLQRVTDMHEAVKIIRIKMLSTIIVSNKLSLEQINEILKACPTVQCILIYGLNSLNRKYAEQKMSRCPQIQGIAVDETQLKRLILKQQAKKDKNLPMPNMIRLNVEQLSRFNRKRISLYSIEGEKNMVNAFEDFCLFCQGLKINHKTIADFKEYFDIREDPQSMLRYYTKQNFLYRVLNKTLKLADSCIETAWIRHPYIQISKAIKARHKKEKTALVSYRGAYFDHTEFSNLRVGDIIQSFGFLSTSLDEECAKIYIKNCFLRVQIDDPNLESEGFTCIEDISNFPEEKQVLINTKNLFIVKDIMQKKQYIELTIMLLTQIPQDYLNAVQQLKPFIGNQGLELQVFHPDLAIKYYQTICQKVTTSSQKAQAYNKLGYVYRRQGNYHKALDYFQKCWNLQIQIFGQDHICLTISYINTGLAYLQLGQYDKAMDFFQKCLKLQINTYGQDSIHLAITYNNIGTTYQAQGNYKKALDYYYKCFQLQSKAYGYDSIKLAITYTNIGNVYSYLGNYDKSLNYYQKCLNLQVKIYGQDYIQLANTYNNIGNIHSSKGNTGQALDYLNKCLNLQIKAFGQDNIQLAITYSNIGNIHNQLGHYNMALNYFYKCLNLQMKAFGQDSIQLAVIYNNIGKLYQNQGNYDLALNYYQKCLNLQIKAFGQDNIHLATTYINIGKLYKDQGNYNKAQNYLYKCLNLQMKAFGQDNIQLAVIFKSLGELHQNQSNYDLALYYYLMCLNLQIKAFGQDNIQLADIYNRIGHTHMMKGNYFEALGYLEKAKMIVELREYLPSKIQQQY